jgi:hypothetical protein
MFFIRPGKVTCAGAVVIFMVLPNSIWKGPDANVSLPAPKVESAKPTPDPEDARVKFRKQGASHLSGLATTKPSVYV